MDAAAGRDGGRIILPQWRGNEQFTSMTPRLVNRAGCSRGSESGGTHAQRLEEPFADQRFPGSSGEFLQHRTHHGIALV